MSEVVPPHVSRPRPQVTVGLPVLNGERWLAAALESILAQTLQDFELLVADNASTDATPEIVREYARRDPRIRVLRHDRQRGAAENFNFVAGLARGPHFKWAAHDDLIEPGFLAACVEVLQSDPSVVLCTSQAAEIDEDDRITRGLPSPPYGREHDPVSRARAFFAQPTACLEVFGVIRTGALRQTRMIGPFVSSDRVLLLELALRGRVVATTGARFLNRAHPMRSIKRWTEPDDRLRWFAGVTHQRSRPRVTWRLAGEYRRAIAAAPLSPAQKLACGAYLARWMGGHGWQLGRELAPSRVRGALSSLLAHRSDSRTAVGA